MQLSSQGDKSAFTQLFHIYKHKIYYFLLKLTGSAQMAEDLTQDVFTKVWTLREQLPSIEKFGSYLFKMGQNYSINAFKKMATETLAHSRMLHNTASNSTDQYLNQKETDALLHNALSRLSNQQRLVYTLSREEGLKYDEIADRLNLSPSTVKNHMIAALRSLRNSFSTHPDIVCILVPVLFICDMLEK